MIFIVVGYPCSGKTSARKFIQDELNCIGFEASDYAKKMVKQSNMIDISEIQQCHGLDIVAKEIITDMTSSSTKYVISGFRTAQEVNLLKSLYDCIVIALESSMIELEKRITIRNRADDNLEDRILSDKLLGVDELIQNSDYKIVNDKNLKYLENELIKIIKER